MVGTANKKRRWLPATAKLKNPKLPLYHTNVYLGPNRTTLSLYQCKRNKIVSVLSSLHRSVKITNSSKKKPNTIHYYNQTKYGVDVADQMAKKYSTKAASRRWPVQVFYNILDLAAINAWIIHKNVTGKNKPRFNFLLELADRLRLPYVQEKQNSAPAPQSQRKVSKRTGTRTSSAASFNTVQSRKGSKKNGNQPSKDSKIPAKRRHCQIKKCNNKSSGKVCFDCNKFICGKCTSLEQQWCVECRQVCSKQNKKK